MALKVPIIIARFFTLTHYRSRLHHLLLALLQSLPCLHYLLTPFLHTLPITFSLCQMTLKYFHDKMQPFSSLIFHYIFFFICALPFWSVHLVIYESITLLPPQISPSPPPDLAPSFEVLGFPSGQTAKNLPVNAGGPGLIPESGRSLGEGNGTPLLYSCLGNPMDRGTWQATVLGFQSVRYDCVTNTFWKDVCGPS